MTLLHATEADREEWERRKAMSFSAISSDSRKRFIDRLRKDLK